MRHLAGIKHCVKHLEILVKKVRVRVRVRVRVKVRLSRYFSELSTTHSTL